VGLLGNTTRSVAVSVATVLLCATLRPHPAAAQDKPLTPVRAAHVPVVTWLPAWVAKDTGLFAKHGLDVSLAPIQNLSLLPGTLGRQFDIVASTPPDLIKAVASGLDLVAVAGEAIETKDNPTTHVIVRKDSSIKGAKDLQGRIIAAPTLGAVIHVSVLYWLKQNGVDPASIRAVEVPFPNMGDQLRSGRLDAAELLEPFAAPLLAEGHISLVDPLLSVGNEVLFPFWIADGNWARANRKVIEAWIAALDDAKVFMDANPAETRAILAKYSRLPEAVVQKVPYPTYRFSIQPEQLRVWVDVLTDLGQVSQTIDKSKLVVTAP
jgi:NitT/TauT family transport system substrate-binding protein